jgi:hypothetical protein
MNIRYLLAMLLATFIFSVSSPARAACEGFLNAIDALEATVKPADKTEASMRTGLTTQPVAPVSVNGHYVRFFPKPTMTTASTQTAQTQR